MQTAPSPTSPLLRNSVRNLSHVLSRVLSRVLLRVTCASLVFLTACTGHLNREDGLFGDDLPALRPQSCDPIASVTANDLSSKRLVAEETPWAARASWPAIVVASPVAQTQTQSIYHRFWQLDSGNPRAIGAFPTLTSACSVPTGPTTSTLVAEGFVAPLNAGWDLLVMPVQMCVTPPGKTHHGAQRTYELNRAGVAE